MTDKHNFEKDIDVPSKQKIMYDYNAKDCEQCSSDSVCCYCKNLTYYKLEDQLKRAEQRIVELNKTIQAKEQECEELKNELIDVKWKIEAQDIELNDNIEQLDQLKKERKALGRAYLTTSELLQDKMKECTNLKAENEELKKHKEVVDKLAGMQVILTNEEKMPMLYENAKDLKLKQLSKTLTEIKEIAEEAAEQSGVSKEYFKRNNYSWKQHQLKALTCKFNIILQKISECEVNDEK